ncbi:MAG: hypothetical protein LBC07_04075 [Elusimicrobiota bacterium]|nr:hypothetical protein [Elusimicrobiota bacterium]
MKKILTLALALIIGIGANAFGAAGQINAKFELGAINNLYGHARLEADLTDGGVIIDNTDVTENLDTTAPMGFAFYGEYLYPIIKILKVGGGMGYSYQGNIPVRFGNTDVKDANNESLTYSANIFPVYLTVQFHPIPEVEGLFVKGNLGLALITSFAFSSPEIYNGYSKTLTSNMYYGISTGYEFASGFICELAFSAINYRVKYTDSNSRVFDDEGNLLDGLETSSRQTWHFSYRRIGLIAGFKF